MLSFCHNAHIWRTDRQTDTRTDRQFYHDYTSVNIRSRSEYSARFEIAIRCTWGQIRETSVWLLQTQLWSIRHWQFLNGFSCTVMNTSWLLTYTNYVTSLIPIKLCYITLCVYAGYCPSYKFRCDMGLCLRRSVYCNGTVECPDGSDEPPNCHSKFFLNFM